MYRKLNDCDYDKSAILVFAENMAILIAFAFFGTVCVLLIKSGTSRRHRKNPPSTHQEPS